MPRKLYGSVNGQTKQVVKLYGSVNGVTKEIKKLYGSSGGVTRLIFPDDPTPSTIALLDVGWTVNSKIKDLANNTSGTHPYDSDTNVHSFVRSSSLPSGFIPSAGNTISSSTSQYPIYIFFDNSTGTMSYYSEASTIVAPDDMADALRSLQSLTDIRGVAGWRLGDQLVGFFYECYSLNDLSPLASWDTSNVSILGNMFLSCSALTDISPLANWNTSNVTDIEDMFWGVNNIDATVLNNWDVSNVTRKANAFTCPVDKRPTWYTP